MSASKNLFDLFASSNHVQPIKLLSNLSSVRHGDNSSQLSQSNGVLGILINGIHDGSLSSALSSVPIVDVLSKLPSSRSN